MQVRQHVYKGPLQCVSMTVQEEGLPGLARGLWATLAREVPGNAIFFASYEVRFARHTMA
jgi:solute carrier family 25 (mitochondrial carnitine/acylcarnitine transporter), member 20/29